MHCKINSLIRNLYKIMIVLFTLHKYTHFFFHTNQSILLSCLLNANNFYSLFFFFYVFYAFHSIMRFDSTTLFSYVELIIIILLLLFISHSLFCISLYFILFVGFPFEIANYYQNTNKLCSNRKDDNDEEKMILMLLL